MKKIRHSIFETNSSSTHVLTIRELSILDEPPYVLNQNIRLSLKDVLSGYMFTTGEHFNTFRDKLEYLFVYALYNLSNMKTFLSVVDKIEKEFNIKIYMPKNIKNLSYDWVKDCEKYDLTMNWECLTHFDKEFEDAVIIYNIITNPKIEILIVSDCADNYDEASIDDIYKCSGHQLVSLEPGDRVCQVCNTIYKAGTYPCLACSLCGGELIKISKTC